MNQGDRGVLAVAQSVFEELAVEQVLERVLQAARELTGARYAALGVLDPSRSRLEQFITSGVDERIRRRLGAPPTGRGVLGELIRDPRPLRLEDVRAHPSSYGFPFGHPEMSSFLGVPVLVAGAPFGNLYLTEKAGGAFTEEDEDAVVAFAAFAGLAIDHARRYSATEQRRDQLEQTVRALDATLQVSRALSGETDLSAVLELIAQRGQALVSADMLLIELLRGDQVELAKGAGSIPEALVGRHLPLEDTVAEAALVTGETQSLADPLTQMRFRRHGAGALGVSAESGLFVPLVFRDRRYGVLIALGSQRGGFDDDDQRLLESFASSSAVAVATATTVAEERRRMTIAAGEAERTRWARELHDETLQALGNLRLVLSSARRREDPESLAAAVDNALEQLAVDISSLRSLIAELRPAALDQLGLAAALSALLDRTRQTGLEVDERVELGTQPTRLTEELETATYRIVQEALTNVGKHAHATRVRVEVVEAGPDLQVLISDDGAGFDPRRAPSGFGLEGIRERVELLDGELRVVSAPGEGTELLVTLTAAHRPPETGASETDNAGLSGDH
jgi:two-component system, NarL family, sensor histidine kinase DevS